MGVGENWMSLYPQAISPTRSLPRDHRMPRNDFGVLPVLCLAYLGHRSAQSCTLCWSSVR